MHQKGMTLIEVMVAVFILASGLLGLGALQARALQFNDSANKRSIAADLATDLAERIRANRSPFNADTSAFPAPPFPPDFTLCTQVGNSVRCQDQVRGTPYRENYNLVFGNENNEMKTWYATLINQLPGATYTLTKDTTLASNYPYTLQYTLTIAWRDDRGTNTDSSYSTVIQ